MITRVQKWGNSQRLRLNKELLSEVEINVGDAVEVRIRDGALVVTPVRRARGGHDLRELAPRTMTRESSIGGRLSAARRGR